MKRTNVVLDEELLEKARRVTGEKTYSGTITKALQEYVRSHDFHRKLVAFQEEAAKGNYFWPGYLEEIRPGAYPNLETKKKRRVSANVRRAPRKRMTTTN